MPVRTFALIIGTVILAAALTVFAMSWLSGGTITAWTIVVVLGLSGALKLYLHRR